MWNGAGKLISRLLGVLFKLGPTVCANKLLLQMYSLYYNLLKCFFRNKWHCNVDFYILQWVLKVKINF